MHAHRWAPAQLPTPLHAAPSCRARWPWDAGPPILEKQAGTSISRSPRLLLPRCGHTNVPGKSQPGCSASLLAPTPHNSRRRCACRAWRCCSSPGATCTTTKPGQPGSEQASQEQQGWREEARLQPGRHDSQCCATQRGPHHDLPGLHFLPSPLALHLRSPRATAGPPAACSRLPGSAGARARHRGGGQPAAARRGRQRAIRGCEAAGAAGAGAAAGSCRGGGCLRMDRQHRRGAPRWRRRKQRRRRPHCPAAPVQRLRPRPARRKGWAARAGRLPCCCLCACLPPCLLACQLARPPT